MMTLMRKLATGFVVKILMLVLVASFALWGVHDVFNGNNRRPPLLTVGKMTVSADEFQSVYDKNREQLKQSAGGHSVPNETMIRLGIPEQVIETLVNDRLIRQEALSMGLRVSDSEVLHQTQQNPAFQDKQGRFDRSVFQQVLASVRLNEAAYIEEMRASEAMRLFGDALLGQAVLHPSLAQVMHLLRLEGRDAAVWVFNQDTIKSNPKPTDADLQAFYDAHKKEYQTTEMRTVGVVRFDPKKVEAAKISDEAVAESYAQNKARFTTPETRDVDQLLYEDEAAAKAAAEALKAGDAWEKVSATAISKKSQHIEAILKARALPGTGEAIFTTKEGAISAPVQSSLGWHLFRVSKIHPESTKSLEAVKDEIRKQLTADAAQDELDRQIGQLEDALANGATLSDAAKAAGVPMQTVGPFDNAGMKADDTRAKDLPLVSGLLDKIGALKVNDTTSALTTEDGSSVVVGVLNIQAPREKPMAEIRPQLVSRWTKEHKAKQMQEVADKIAAQKGDVGLEARAEGASRVQMQDLRRASKAQLRDASNQLVPVPKEMVDALFSLRPGEHTKTFELESGDVAFAVLEAIHAAPTRVSDQKGAQAAYMGTLRAISNEVASDYYALYLRYLKTKYPVKLDQAQLTEIINPRPKADVESE